MAKERIPLTLNGKRIGWAYPTEQTPDGTISFEIDDEETIEKLSRGITEGLSIED